MGDIFDELSAGHNELHTITEGDATIFPNLMQGSEAWFNVRLGVLTASEMKNCVTPTLKVANNDKTRAHVWEIAAQRITNYIEPSYEGFDMLRGKYEEDLAYQHYRQHYTDDVRRVGFVRNDTLGFPLGYSPDWLVGADGQAEVKGRVQKYQIQTICEHVALAKSETIPDEYVIQVQTGLMVTGRKWCDFVSYSNGLPMVTIRVYPDATVQAAIREAATAFETQVRERIRQYRAAMDMPSSRLIETERQDYQEILAA